MNDELKPCPFCGWDASPDEFEFSEGYAYLIRCDECGAEPFDYTPTLALAMRKWNRRADLAAQPVPVEVAKWIRAEANWCILSLAGDESSEVVMQARYALAWLDSQRPTADEEAEE